MEISAFGNIIEKLLKSLGGEASQIGGNKIIEYLAEEYNRNLFIKSLIHRNTPVRLTDIYVPLKVSKYSRYEFFMVGYENHKAELINVDLLFSDNNFVTLIGDAGGGKSTLIKYLFINSISKPNDNIPIKIELRELNDYKLGFREYVISNFLISRGITANERISKRILQKGRFTFFLDGYDEIDKQIKSQVTNQINSFIREFNNNKYLISSRPFSGIELFPLCKNFYLLDFDEEQIINFIRNQKAIIEKEVIEKICDEVKNQLNSDYSSFLRNPLLLSMFILTFRHNSVIPQLKITFYQQVFNALFFEHDSLLKRSFKRKRNSDLTKEQFEKILMSFSFISFFEQQFIFTIEYFDKYLTKIKGFLNLSKFDNEDVKNDLLVSIGVMYKDGNFLTYSHKSLQEYFAAKYMFSLKEEKKYQLYFKLIEKYSFGKDLTIDFFKLDGSIKNFCFLLMEFDPNEFNQNFSIPLIERILNSLELTVSINRFSINLKFLNSDIFNNLLEFQIISNEIIHLRQSLEKINLIKKDFTNTKSDYLLSVEKLLNHESLENESKHLQLTKQETLNEKDSFYRRYISDKTLSLIKLMRDSLIQSKSFYQKKIELERDSIENIIFNANL